MRSRVTSKGQVTIPWKIRETMGIKPGDEVEFKEDEAGSILLKRKKKTSPFKKYEGYLKTKRGSDVDSIIEDMRGK